MSFRGYFDPKSGTNQSIRYRAEQKAAPNNFHPDIPYSTQAGTPVVNSGGMYQELVVPRGPGQQQDDKRPFTTKGS